MSRLRKTAGDVVKFPNSNYLEHESIQEISEYAKTLVNIEASSLTRYYAVEDYIKSLDITNYYYDDTYGALRQLRESLGDLESAAEEAMQAINNITDVLKQMTEEPGPVDN